MRELYVSVEFASRRILTVVRCLFLVFVISHLESAEKFMVLLLTDLYGQSITLLNFSHELLTFAPDHF